MAQHRNRSLRSPRAAARDRSARARLAQAVGATRPPIECLESRRLLAITWDFTIVDPGSTFNAWYDDVLMVMEEASAQWSAFLDSDASIEMSIEFFNDPNDGTIAAAGPNGFIKVDEDAGVDVVDGYPVHEIKTGVDANGGAFDAGVIWNAALFISGETFFSIDPDRDVPDTSFDALSTALHELGHVLGFMNLIDDETGQEVFINPDTGNFAKTTYDQNIVFAGGDPFFTGFTTQSQYGGPVGLAVSSIAHYGNVFGPSADLFQSLMSPFGFPGSKVGIELIDLAILADIGMPVIADFPDTPLTEVPQAGTLWTLLGTDLNDTITLSITGSRLIVAGLFGRPDPWELVDPGILGIIVDLQGGHDRFIFAGSTAADQPLPITINGGSGNDTIQGSPNGDTIFGNAGNDVLVGRGGQDVVSGNGGNDRLFGDDGNDLLYGGAGNDMLDGGDNSDRLFGNDGNDQLYGRGGHDALFGGSGDDSVDGGGGNDTLFADAGADTLHGGIGFDVADYSARSDNLLLTLDGIANDGSVGEGDHLATKLETIIGGNGSDKIVGNGGNTVLRGGPGRDTINGGGGDDTLLGEGGDDKLEGSAGDDELDGGTGNDTLVGGGEFDLILGGSGRDLIVSFDRWGDTIDGGAGIDLLETDEYDGYTNVENIEQRIFGL